MQRRDMLRALAGAGIALGQGPQAWASLAA